MTTEHINIERTDLNAHVDLCAQRYKEISANLRRLENMVNAVLIITMLQLVLVPPSIEGIMSLVLKWITKT